MDFIKQLRYKRDFAAVTSNSLYKVFTEYVCKFVNERFIAIANSDVGHLEIGYEKLIFFIRENAFFHLQMEYYICSSDIIASNSFSSVVWSKPVMLHLQMPGIKIISENTTKNIYCFKIFSLFLEFLTSVFVQTLKFWFLE